MIPNAIAENSNDAALTQQLKNLLPSISHFLAEDIRSARRYLSSLKIYPSIESLHFSVLNKDTSEADIPRLMEPVLKGLDVGVISESGCPGIADPGSLAVRYAHQKNIRVIPLVGPSSILLALMASGLNGQRFAFHGYLPIDTAEVGRAIKTFEKESKSKQQTQVFIETPYRNNALFRHLLKNLSPTTKLCIARDITGENEFIRTQNISRWKTQTIELPKNPTVFLFLA